MKRILSTLLSASVLFASYGHAAIQAQPQTPTTQNQTTQVPLTNKDVVDLTRAGIHTDVIVAKIRSSATNFDTSTAALAELKAAGIHDAVIMAMVKPEKPVTVRQPVGDSVVSVPDGTEVQIELKTSVSGEQLKIGDVVDFVVLEPVTIGGTVVFEKGSVARARVTTAKRAGHWGKAGKLEWAMQDVQSVDGNRIPARFTKREVGDSKGGTVAVAAVATTVLLGPVGLFWGLKKGKPAIIAAGNRYSAFVEGDTKIKGRLVERAAATP